ncbi:MAG: NAD(P)-dependent oxidoreductase [Cypionkella sp.]|nr:NAD(P)-dependent oxidoreductase [Cypionkella sp.]
MRVLFTGGAGKAGRHVVPFLAGAGHTVLNLDLVPLGHAGVPDLICDLTDLGQVYSAMRSHIGFEGLETGQGAQVPDAVVHFAAIPRILIAPDSETYRVNVISTYNVIEAAAKMGVRKIIIASSETTYGVCFSEGQTDPAYLPLDEEYDVSPMDSYGASKVAGEVTARAFARRFGIDIYALRIGNVMEPQDYADFPAFAANPASRRRIAFSYIDARDLGQMVDLCLSRDGLGFQVFNVSNDNNPVPQPNSALLDAHFPNVPLKRKVTEDEALFSSAKAKRVLGFAPKHNYQW